MNMNYSYPTTMYEGILAQLYVLLEYLQFLLLTMKKNKQKIFFYQKYVHLEINTFINCSLITVAHVYVNVLL